MWCFVAMTLAADPSVQVIAIGLDNSRLKREDNAIHLVLMLKQYRHGGGVRTEDMTFQHEMQAEVELLRLAGKLDQMRAERQAEVLELERDKQKLLLEIANLEAALRAGNRPSAAVELKYARDSLIILDRMLERRKGPVFRVEYTSLSLEVVLLRRKNAVLQHSIKTANADLFQLVIASHPYSIRCR